MGKVPEADKVGAGVGEEEEDRGVKEVFSRDEAVAGVLRSDDDGTKGDAGGRIGETDP